MLPVEHDSRSPLMPCVHRCATAEPSLTCISSMLSSSLQAASLNFSAEQLKTLLPFVSNRPQPRSKLNLARPLGLKSVRMMAEQSTVASGGAPPALTSASHTVLNAFCFSHSFFVSFFFPAQKTSEMTTSTLSSKIRAFLI